MNAALRDAIAAALRVDRATWCPVASGAWASNWSLRSAAGLHFVKIGRIAGMLACEAEGLAALAATDTVRVPRVIAHGRDGNHDWLVLEWLSIDAGPLSRTLGAALARLHRAAAPHGGPARRFGWHRDNWLGATPQANDWHDDWCAFFRDCRLAPQLALVAKKGFASIARDGERLLDALPALLAGHAPEPSLLHGDLWAGNAGTVSGEGVVFDPAVYVGDRETDLAMTGLFGGFGREFLRGYDEVWPLADGYPLRRDLYNLYHLLNHVNLFGETYVAKTRRTLASLLATVGH